jgi:hypothetical protein
MNEGLDPEAWKDSLHAVNDDVDPLNDEQTTTTRVALRRC